MTIDTNNWFANLGNFPKFDALPGADKFQSLLADAGERSQEAVRQLDRSRRGTRRRRQGECRSVRRRRPHRRRPVPRASARTSLLAAVKASSRLRKPSRRWPKPSRRRNSSQLQSEIARTSFDRLVSEGSRLTESMVKLAGEAIQPLSNRASANAERIKNAVA